jgi:hypothetical protein
VVSDDVPDVVEQVRQVGLGRFASPGTEGVLAGDAGASFVESLADGIASPAEQTLGLTLAEIKRLQGLSDVATSRSPGLEQGSGLPDEVAHLGG